MILEHVLLSVSPEQVTPYLLAFERAKPIILAQPGCCSCRLLPQVEVPGAFLLLVEWERKEQHTEGFRRREAYREWSRLLHPFYAKVPSVSYFEITK